MTEQRSPLPSFPSALVVARRALVAAVAALVAAAFALVAAFWDGSDGDPAESAAPEQAQIDVEAVEAMAELAAATAQEAAAKAIAAEEAFAAALAVADGTIGPEVIAGLEAQLGEARTDAAAALATAQAAVDAAARIDAAPAADTTPDDGAAVEDAAVEDAPEPEDAAAVEETPVPEDADGAVALPGESYEFGPSAGTGLAVVGVRHDSALNVRDVPNGEVIARLDNVMDGVRDPAVYVREPDTDDLIATVDLEHGIVATGNTRQLPTTIWHEFGVGGLTGWSSATYLAPLGAGRDATAEVVEALGGTPTADTLSDLGLQVAALYASSGEVQSRTTISSQPGVFEALGDITLDVIGLPDDSVRGYRVNITADAGAEDWTQDDAGPFTLRSVTVTPICDSHRGVSEEGLCQ